MRLVSTAVGPLSVSIGVFCSLPVASSRSIAAMASDEVVSTVMISVSLRVLSHGVDFGREHVRRVWKVSLHVSHGYIVVSNLSDILL